MFGIVRKAKNNAKQQAKKSTPQQQRGAAAEARACAFLQAQGLAFVAANVRYRDSELDLVMQAGTTLVFVEVRQRSDRGFGGALASVTARKQQRVQLAAQRFLLAHPRWQNAPCRFDVIAIEGDELSWIQAAFTKS